MIELSFEETELVKVLCAAQIRGIDLMLEKFDVDPASDINAVMQFMGVEMTDETVSEALRVQIEMKAKSKELLSRIKNDAGI